MREPLTLYLAAPRGFCAGVDRAIRIVEMALEKWGAPVYVRHEIVHNKYVVDDLRAKGAVFVEELDECPNDRPVIFSAHGVPKSVPAEASRREMIYVDATCPLVSKVHIEAERHHSNGLQMVMIGHAGHPETLGTMGQLPQGEVLLVETADDVAGLQVRDPDKLAYITQTTLSVDDTAGIVAALQALLAWDMAEAMDWPDLTHRLARQGYGLAPAGGGLILIRLPCGARVCKASELGFAYRSLVKRFQTGFPGHPHGSLDLQFASEDDHEVIELF